MTQREMNDEPHPTTTKEELREVIDAFYTFACLVCAMRTAQKKYFRSRTESSLIESKMNEKVVDREIEKLMQEFRDSMQIKLPLDEA